MPVMARPLQRYRRPFFGGSDTALNKEGRETSPTLAGVRGGFDKID